MRLTKRKRSNKRECVNIQVVESQVFSLSWEKRFVILICLGVLPVILCGIAIGVCVPISFAAMGMQVLLVWCNYFFTQDFWEDVHAFCFFSISSFGITFTAEILTASYNMYYEYSFRISDFLTDVVFLAWLILNLVFVGIVLLWRCGLFSKKIRVCSLVVGTGLVLAVFGTFSLKSDTTYRYQSADVSESFVNCQVAWNDEYQGMITENDRVEVRDVTGDKLFSLGEKSLGICPCMLALGDDGCYVYGDDDQGDSYILQFDYQGVEVARRKTKDLDSLVWKNGILFLGTYVENDDNIRVIDGFWANRYLAEKEFAKGKIRKCKADESGICEINGVVLYDHEEKYFSTNPCIEGKRETVSDIFGSHVKQILCENGWTDCHFRSWQWQQGYVQYGVVNAYDRYNQGVLRPDHEGALAYCKDGKTGKVLWSKTWEDVFLIMTTEDFVVYQDGTKVIREMLDSGEKEVLLTDANWDDEHYSVEGEVLQMGYNYNWDSWVRWKK